MGLTNEGMSERDIMRREKTARRTGRWPPWRRHDLGFHGAGRGWLRECKVSYENGVFAVLVRELGTPWGPITHAAMRSARQAVDLTWSEKQRIKDEIFGPDRTAIEVYPTAADLVDGADMFHLWVLPAGFSLPFGIHTTEPPALAEASN